MLYQNYSSFMAPQTEIPLTGEMSRSDKRVTARYEQLEPVTLNMLSATAVASLYRYDKTIHRIVLSATDNSRVPLLQYGVAGERTVQRCRQKQKDRSMSDLFICVLVTKIKLLYYYLFIFDGVNTANISFRMMSNNCFSIRLFRSSNECKHH